MSELSYLLTSPAGLEDLVQEEVQLAIGEDGGAVTGHGAGRVRANLSLAAACRLLLWSRVASRLYRVLATGPVANADELYQLVASFPWEQWFRPGLTFAVQFDGDLQGVRNSMYGALRIKDALVDRCREQTGRRPSVDSDQPDLRIAAWVEKGEAVIAVDCQGGPLHQRHYRLRQGAAPLKENLAAAMIKRARWDGQRPLVDPFCGSGTIIIEAALMAADIAPGLLRNEPALLEFPDAEPQLWQKLVAEAQQRRRAGLERCEVPLQGCDLDPRQVAFAEGNAKAAGVADLCAFDVADACVIQPGELSPGLILSNPPYGMRLGDLAETLSLYARFGANLKTYFRDWQLSLLSSDEGAIEQLRMRPERRHQLYNGPLKCRLMHYAISGGAVQPVADDLANRLRKNLKKLEPWAEREQIQAYRLYDADLPDYNLAVDRYDDWLVVQEYAAPDSIEPEKARRRRDDALVALAQFNDPAKIAFKTRQRQKGKDQYERQAERDIWLQVREHQARLWVNPCDYLDTGLFLDHRPMRQWLFQHARDKAVLNLFCYTASATVQAALGGAKSSLSVDMSNTYLEWAQRNFELNGLDNRHHRLLRDDCVAFLTRPDRRFDLVFLDPPTFSNSKRMDGMFDVQADYLQLLERLRGWLNPKATVVFSTNHTRFRFDEAAVNAMGFIAEDVTAQSIPQDFARNQRIHRCWLLHWQGKN